jgi:hypothetical protein
LTGPDFPQERNQKHLFAATGTFLIPKIKQDNVEQQRDSNEFLEESTATSSSVMLSGARRVKEMPGLDIGEYSTDSPK